MRARFGTAHLVAVVAGLATALLLLSWTRSSDQLVAVMQAAEDIRAGTLIEATNLQPTEIPADSSIASVFLPAADSGVVIGQVAVRSIPAGEPILRSDVRPAVTEDGRRAMSIPLAPANAVGGDLAVGDAVDVLAVTDAGTRFVAEGLPVLALPDEGQGGVVGGSTAWWVVLAVDDVDALEIADGMERGTIYLLRSTGTPDLSVRELTRTQPAGELPTDVAAAPGG